MRVSLALAMVLITALPARAQQQPETLSLLGAPLYAPALSHDAREKLEAELNDARGALDKNPSSIDAALAVARADMGLGHVDDALEALTRARERTPDEPRLLLESARDLIVNRKFDVAERDARKAAGTLPEANCALGFALYLEADYVHAKDAYANCADPGVFAYLTDRFTGGSHVPRPAFDEHTIPSASPLHLPGAIVHTGRSQKSLVAAYVDAAERLAAGKRKDAAGLLKPIVEKHMNEWMTPAYIAAEADYSRVGKKGRTKKR